MCSVVCELVVFFQVILECKLLLGGKSVMSESAVIARKAFLTGMEEFAGKIFVHVNAEWSFGASTTGIELARFQLSCLRVVVAERTIIAKFTAPFQEELAGNFFFFATWPHFSRLSCRARSRSR